ncbi:hypothetical protein FS837_008131, partial [Tulasnella sp. UAMH 9824]
MPETIWEICWWNCSSDMGLKELAFIAPHFEPPPKPAVIKAATRKRKQQVSYTPASSTQRRTATARSTRRTNLAQQISVTADAALSGMPDASIAEDADYEATTANEEHTPFFPSAAGESTLDDWPTTSRLSTRP